MYHYILELSKYAITLLMALYTLECFLVFRHREEGERKGIYIRQNVYLFSIQFLAYLTMCLKTGQIEYLFFYAFLQIALFSAMVLYQMIYPNVNRLIINNMCMLLGIGFVMLTRLDFDKAIKQFFIVAVSLSAALAIPFFVHKLKFLKHLKWVYGSVGVLALSIVLILGQVTHGSKISYTIAGITLQPSEFVKIIFVFLIASLLYEATDLKQILFSALWAGAHVCILVLSKDLGSALIFFVGYLFMVLIASRNYLYFLAGVVGGGLASVAGYYLFSHVRVRVQAFLDPFSVIDREGYQITQSLFAIGSGSWFGMGLYQGTPGDIPFVESDFMFSAVAEEFGVLFALCMILVCLSCFVMFMNIALRLQNKFYQLIAAGFGVMYIFQVFLTIGGGIKFIPLTGVTLPLVSYGGSSVLTTLMMFAVIQGLYMIRVEEQKEATGAKRKNREIMMITYFFTALFVAMMVYLGYYVANNEQELLNNSYNSRQQILLSKNSRGTIYSAEGEVLAETITGEDGKEKRYYPYDTLFCHAVGFSTKGKTGIEAMANYYLINSNIALSEKIDNELSGKKNPGDSVYTTLRTDLQEIADRSLGVYKGAIIVSDVKTGALLAMISKPDFSPATVAEDWDSYLEDKKSSVLLNRATQGVYPPGSTFKIVTALNYIREHKENYNQYRYQCTGSFRLGENKISCYHGSVHNVVDLTKSFAKSCNSSFANMGVGLNREQFGKTLNDLGFNQPLPTEYNSMRSNLIVTGETSDKDMIQISIGQGNAQITPMHLNLITNAIAHQGTAMKPYVMDRVVTADGGVIKKFQPEVYKSLMTAEEADILRGLMTAVVEQGTASKLKGLSYTAAGKTGSAEYNGVKEDSHAWFTGFAPAEAPEISVTIIVEGIGSGGDYAVPIAKRLFDAYFIG